MYRIKITKMIDYAVAVQTIKDSVSALDVGQAIGLNIDRHGRCSCPFHNGNDRNMKLFPGNRGYSCFVCHAGGDVLSFVQKYYSMSFRQSLEWFDATFHLGLELHGTIDPSKKEAAKKALQRRKNAIAFAEWRERTEFDMALTAGEIVRKLESIRDEKKPRTYGEEWDPEFCNAVVLLPEARRFADDCMMYCTKEKG